MGVVIYGAEIIRAAATHGMNFAELRSSSAAPTVTATF